MIVWNPSEQEYYIENGPYVIEDSPRYQVPNLVTIQHRSILVDTARHFLPVPFLHTVIDSMAYSKYNVFHWHLTDDDSFPLEVKKYPMLNENGAYSRFEKYSQVIQ